MSPTTMAPTPASASTASPSTSTTTYFANLDDLALNHVYSFLDIATLRTFSRSRSDERMTYQSVLWSVLASKDYTTHKVLRETLTAALHKKTIVLPSPQRLLRLLVDDCICEACGKTNCTTIVTGGLRMCTQCTAKLLTFDSDWTARYADSVRPLRDTNGDPIGPTTNNNSNNSSNSSNEYNGTPTLDATNMRPRNVSKDDMEQLLTFYEKQIKPSVMPSMSKVLRHWARERSIPYAPYEEMLEYFREFTVEENE